MAVAMLSRGRTFYHGCSYVVKGENILPWLQLCCQGGVHFTMAVAMLLRGRTFYHGCSYVVKGENILPWL